MIEHCRHNPAGPAGGSRDDRPARSILFADCQSVCVNHPTALQGRLVTACPYVVSRGFACEVQRSRQCTLTVKTTLDSRLHGIPHLTQIIPEIIGLALLHIFPVAPPMMFAPGLDVLERVQVVYRILMETVACSLPLRQSTAADAVDRPFVFYFLMAIIRTEHHAVGMIRQEHLRFPFDFHRGYRLQHVDDGLVRHVSPARSSQTSIQRHLETHCLRMTAGEDDGSPLRSHRMAARRSFSDSEYFS